MQQTSLVARWATTLSLVLLLPVPAAAQAVEDDGASEQVGLRDEAPRVFLDCARAWCDFSYIRRQIGFVNWVRDSEIADIHVLVVSQRTGSGGREYDLEFIGRQQFAAEDERLEFGTLQTDTFSEERAKLVRAIKLGLIPYVAQTPLARHLRVSYDAPAEEPAAQEVEDPWHSWVFEVDLGGGIDLEARERSYRYDGSFSANRVTEQWRIRNRIDAWVDKDVFEREERTIRSSSERYSYDGAAIYSLAEHWSTGLFGDVFSNTTFNYRIGTRLTPALEYSIFPYEEADRREVTFAYMAGVEALSYRDTTVFNKLEETLLQQRLMMRLSVTEAWGNLFVRLLGSHYFHDLEKYSLDMYGRLSIRLFKGLSARLQLNAERVRDQLYLPKGDVSLEDLLLRRRQLATGYEISGSLGLSYTFGSIYNNVVNTRL